MIKFYVSPVGNDANSGTLEKPFATLNRARNAVREVNKDMQEDIVVYLRGGQYFLDKTVEFDESDSGTNAYKIYYKAYDNEIPVIIGGKKITEWEEDTDGVYKAYLGKDWRFYTLFENGVRANIAASEYLHAVKKVEGEGTTKFVFKDQNFISTLNYSSANIYVWPGADYWYWFTETQKITEVNFSTNTITLKNPLAWDVEVGCRYKIQNVREFIKDKGQFYLDENNSYLYYKPYSLPIEKQEIIAPVMKRIIQIKGASPEKLVHDINFEGLHLTISDFSNRFDMSIDTVESQQNEPEANREGIIYIENARSLTINACKITNAGYSGIFMNRYAQYNTVYGNWIEDMGYSGVYLCGWGIGKGNFKNAEEAHINKLNKISNNYIYNIGNCVGNASGVYLVQSGDNEVSHNKISNSPRYGISLKGMDYFCMEKNYYGKEVTYDNHWDFLYSRNNVICYNDISDVMKDSQDGGLYESWGCGQFNVVENNYFHDTNCGIPQGMIMTIYLDDASDYTTIRNNIIYNVSGGTDEKTFNVLLKGIYNKFINNIVINTKSYACVSFQEDLDRNDHLQIERNIFYNCFTKAVYRFYDWKEDKISSCNSNIFYSDEFTNINSLKVIGIPNEDTWKNWTSIIANKFDQNSIIADPLFENLGNRNFTLKSGSLALEMGFENIDFNKIGLKKDFPWEIK